MLADTFLLFHEPYDRVVLICGFSDFPFFVMILIAPRAASGPKIKKLHPH